jgi:tetratricopeptide (TPR) repeat protein
MARRLDLKPWVAQAAVFAANVANYQNDLDAAHSYYQEAVSAARVLGGDALLGTALVGLGLVAMARGDWAGALTQLDAGIEASRRSGSVELVGSLSFRALVLIRLGNRDMARASVAEAEEMRRRSGYLVNRHCLAVLGELALEDGDLEAASAYYADATAGTSLTAMFDWPTLHPLVNGLPRLALAKKRPEAAARVLASFDAQRARHHISVTPSLVRELEQVTADVRANMTAEEWEQAQAEGAAITVQDAIAEVVRV